MTNTSPPPPPQGTSVVGTMNRDPRLDAPRPAGTTRIVVTSREEANAAWRMLQQQQVIHQAAILVPPEGVWFSAQRAASGRWRLAKQAGCPVVSPRPTVG